MKLKLQQACRMMAFIMILSMILGSLGPGQLGMTSTAKAEESIILEEEGTANDHILQEEIEPTEEAESPKQEEVESLPEDEELASDDPLIDEFSMGADGHLLLNASADGALLNNGMPDLIITEIVTKSSGVGELYEYVEIYNTTDQPINLDGYQLRYNFDLSNPTAGNYWMIEQKIIEPKSPLVLWLKKFDNPNSPLVDFNANYKVDLTEDQVFEVKLTTSAQGLHNSDLRTVGFAYPSSNGKASANLMVTALINDGEVDGITDKSIIYKYSDRGVAMEKIANGQTATPGTLVPGQLQTPYNLSAEPGDGAIDLSWMSFGGSSFKIYYHPASNPEEIATVNTDNLSYRVENLINNKEYVFWVTTVLDGAQESPGTKPTQTMPVNSGDLNPPAVPTGLKAEPGTNRIQLSWDKSEELNLAGYQIYVDGVRFKTLTGTDNHVVIGPFNKNTSYSVAIASFNFIGRESARTASIMVQPADRVPDLLITELVPDTDNFASLDAFEFIELYNASEASIDLQGYKVASSTWEKTIDRSVVIQPGEAVVLWTRRAEIAPITLEAFNSYYFSSYKSKYLSEDQVYIIHDVGGLVNGGATVTVKDPDGIEVSRASYTQADAPLNKSATFTYPRDGSTVMRLLAGAQKMTPGTVSDAQVPDHRDGNAPMTPANVQVTAGSGTAKVTWLPNSDPNLFKYNIYKNGNFEHFVPASKQEFIVYQLAGNTEYQIEVSAVDHRGNESAKSAPITVKPNHLNITQEERAINPNDPKYQTLWDMNGVGPVIPGLVEDLVPQGLTYYKEKDWLLSVYYRNDQRPGVLSVMDAKTDELIKSVHLYNEDGTPYRGHAGGVVVTHKHVMISSEQYMFLIDLNELINSKDNDEIQFKGRITVDLDAAFATFNDGVLWVGEFYHSTAYPTDPSHHIAGRDGKTYSAWIEGFPLDPLTDLPSADKWNGNISTAAIPDYVLVIPDRIQGAVFVGDSMILSQSYGRNNDSTLFRYNNPFNKDPHQMVSVGGHTVPLWFLDDQSLKENNDKLTVVPMTEGLTVRDDYLYVMPESGANYYRYTTTYIMDRMLKIHLDQWDQYGVKYIEGLPAEMRVGETLQARVVEGRGKHAPVDHTTGYSFSSSNEEVLGMTASGQVTAKQVGDAIITARSGSHALSYNVKVTDEVPAPFIPSLGLTPGREVSTTRVTGLQDHVTYQYVKGSAGSQRHPSVGDEPHGYTQLLTNATNIAAAVNNHIFVVELDSYGKIARWADLLVTAADIKQGSTPGPNPPVTPSPETSPSTGSTTAPTESKVPPKTDEPLTSPLPTAEQQVVNRMVEQQGKKANAHLTVLADAFEYHAAKVGKPQTVKIPVQLPTNNVPVAVYEVGGDGSLTYVGGKLTGSVIEVELAHAGKYVVLAYDKTFADLRSQHWAYEAVRQLSAMQIVAGMNARDFAPQQEVTRAEFIAMLVRTLGLKSSGNAGFADVPQDSWYAEAMAAAVEAGLVAGMGDGKLAPNEVITREQMAKILVRAYTIKTGNRTKGTGSIPFNDRENVSEWAKDDLSAAYQLGLVHGHASGQYMPQSTTARAEAAKAIFNFIHAVDK